ncbi:hypoxanthine phosphoribosyltransferase [Thalassoroseus pseudoceratinae]|uniref:hypoxanthine phosphoribosyltransferase n=1 Tax=Thalassoroseus pseudoceratinae TaxID=2713176 RepID=UPI001421E3C2|nr:hypoxanthine phosphoribosyltransferase [Thalassoroseus pseudoceratinae]
MRTLLSTETIAQRVTELGKSVTNDTDDEPLTVIGVLTGSLIFLADLVRKIETPTQIGLIQASSYRGTATRPGELSVDFSLLPDITGRNVLLVDDILDTGQTLQRLVAHLQGQTPKTLKTAVLLWKKVRTEVEIQPDYTGFQIPDEFVVGYGLDYNDHYRHLPHIAVLDENDL